VKEVRKKAAYTNEEMWETARKNTWLRKLLSSSSEDEEGREGKKTKMEDKYARFGESSRWVKNERP
jgi:hypothetical protein